ncbi:hypothetical protein [Spongiibacter tropicus]|nr:hypothetical protein [Spongiibacter tropicus]
MPELTPEQIQTLQLVTEYESQTFAGDVVFFALGVAAVVAGWMLGKM